MPITILQKGKQEAKKIKKEIWHLGICTKEKGKTMGINVSTSMGFENREFLKNTAKSILQKNGAESQTAEETVKNIDFETREKYSADLSILRSSAQVTLNKSLKETLNYLKAHANDKKKKEYILGKLWEDFTDNGDTYQGELKDIVIDFNEDNIFAA